MLLLRHLFSSQVLTASFLLGLTIFSFGQSPQTPAPNAEQVVRISTQLVQIDAVVTDKKGQHVDDLKSDDFELFIDGKRQDLAFFNLVRLSNNTPLATNSSSPTALAGPVTMPTKMIAPEKVQRTIAFIVDDLGLSFASTNYVRQAIKKFVDEQMQEGDLVAIVRTARGLGSLQQFTTEKRILSAAIDKISWRPLEPGQISIPVFGNLSTDDPLLPSKGKRTRDINQPPVEAEQIDDFRESVFTVGTLGAANFVIRGMRELPGRKMAILLSDGVPFASMNDSTSQVFQNVRRLVDLANRSSVVIYSVDAKGVWSGGFEFEENVRQLRSPRALEVDTRRAQLLFESQSGLAYLAQETGGIAIFNQNFLHLAVKDVLQDNHSYYLLGFDPDDAQFNGHYHKIKINVKRPDLKVRTRAGYFGVEDKAAIEKPKTPTQQILSALFSPFGARDLQLQMTSVFINSEKEGSFVRSLFHLDPAGFTLIDLPAGKKRLTLDFAGFAFDEKGFIIDTSALQYIVELDEKEYAQFLVRGLDHNLDVPIKKAGAYQFRAVVRDAETGRLGAAGQFIQIPDLKKKRLAMSGIVMKGAGSNQEWLAANTNDIYPTPQVRKFSRTNEIEYSAILYNATVENKIGKPQLTLAIKIYQAGKPVYESAPIPIDASNLKDYRRVAIGGKLHINGLTPGEYLLQVLVTDALANLKYARTEQWMDFTVH